MKKSEITQLNLHITGISMLSIVAWGCETFTYAPRTLLGVRGD